MSFASPLQIEVIEEAIKYIAQLQETLAARLETPTRSGESKKLCRKPHRVSRTPLTLPRATGTTPSPNQAQTSDGRPRIVREKKRRLASYMIKTQRHTLASGRKLGGKSAQICVVLSNSSAQSASACGLKNCGDRRARGSEEKRTNPGQSSVFSFFFHPAPDRLQLQR